MPENQTSPSLEDLLGGLDTGESLGSSETSSSTPSSQTQNPSPNTSPEVTSLDDLLGDSPLSDTPPSPPAANAGRMSRKASSPEEKTPNREGNTSPMSLDDLLGNTDEPQNNTSIHIQDAHHKENEENTPEKSDNVFHKGFKDNALGGEELLENIENYQEDGLHLGNEENEEEKREEDPFILLKEKEEEAFQQKDKQLRQFLVIAQSSIVFGVIALVASFFVFSYLLDTPGNGILGNLVEKNYGIELETKRAQITELRTEERDIKKEIERSEKIIDGFKNNSVLEAIIEDRIDWIQIINEINQVRCEANPLSDISQCKKDLKEGKAIINPFTFENYTTKGGMHNGQIDVIISGKASGSQGYIFQKISRLIETFNDSKYFSGASMRQYSKTQDSRVGFYMPFTMKLIYHKQGKILETEAEIPIKNKK